MGKQTRYLDDGEKKKDTITEQLASMMPICDERANERGGERKKQ